MHPQACEYGFIFLNTNSETSLKLYLFHGFCIFTKGICIKCYHFRCLQQLHILNAEKLLSLHLQMNAFLKAQRSIPM